MSTIGKLRLSKKSFAYWLILTTGENECNV